VTSTEVFGIVLGTDADAGVSNACVCDPLGKECRKGVWGKKRDDACGSPVSGGGEVEVTAEETGRGFHPMGAGETSVRHR